MNKRPIEQNAYVRVFLKFRGKAIICEIDGSKDLRIEEIILLGSYLHKRFRVKKV